MFLTFVTGICFALKRAQKVEADETTDLEKDSHAVVDEAVLCTDRSVL